MPTAEQITDWKKRVDESNGSLRFVSEAFKERAKALEAKRVAYNEKVKEMAKLEIEMRVEQDNLLIDMRREIEKEDADVWIKDIALVGEAAKEDIYIVHLVQPQPRSI
jgi:hypothetical protein